MTKRKPPGVSWESFAERQIREAQERGEFDNLPGAGKPIPGLGGPHDELWWLKQMLAREKLEVTPAALTLRKEVEQAVERIRAAGSEKTVRRLVEEINEKIVAVNRSVTTGPPSNIAPMNADDVIRRWRNLRES